MESDFGLFVDLDFIKGQSSIGTSEHEEVLFVVEVKREDGSGECYLVLDFGIEFVVEPELVVEVAWDEEVGLGLEKEGFENVSAEEVVKLA